MRYSFDFGVVIESYSLFLQGALMTLQLSVIAMLIGLAIAILMVLLRDSAWLPLRWLARTYVEVIRNTPFLVQIFLVYLGLPSLGIRMDPNTAAVAALAVNVGAYATEIIRGGVMSIDRGQTEAGLALGLNRLQIFFYIILVPSLRVIYPALTSQFILLMLTSSVAASISADELTYVAQNIESMTFRSFEIYIVVTLIYLVMTLILSRVFALIERLFFSYPTK